MTIAAPTGEEFGAIDGGHFKAWFAYDGILHQPADTHPLTGEHIDSTIYGWENVTRELAEVAVRVPAGGATFGYITQGAVTVWDGETPLDGTLLRAHRWFALPDGAKLHLHPDTRVVAIQRHGWRGLRSFGGPIEAAGRLRYIDSCTDTLLAMPPMLGDACLNHLHFPAGIEQTEHFHPTTRAGIVAKGYGYCETPDGKTPLTPGLIFHIPAGGLHRFLTEDESMDVIAYHPDTDWGPTNEDHPMLNRTWVDGAKMDNTGEQHRATEIVTG